MSTPSLDPFRCSAASRSAAEPLAGHRVEGQGVPAARGARAVGRGGAAGQPAARRLPGVADRRSSGGTGSARCSCAGPVGRSAVPVRVFAAHAGDGAQPGSARALLEDLGEVCSLDVAGLADGPLASFEQHPGTLLLVCTHGRHDACCAERGRPFAAALAQVAPEETWEVSHIGGDRFAANVLDAAERALLRAARAGGRRGVRRSRTGGSPRPRAPARPDGVPVRGAGGGGPPPSAPRRATGRRGAAAARDDPVSRTESTDRSRSPRVRPGPRAAPGRCGSGPDAARSGCSPAGRGQPLAGWATRSSSSPEPDPAVSREVRGSGRAGRLGPHGVSEPGQRDGVVTGAVDVADEREQPSAAYRREDGAVAGLRDAGDLLPVQAAASTASARSRRVPCPRRCRSSSTCRASPGGRRPGRRARRPPARRPRARPRCGRPPAPAGSAACAASAGRPGRGSGGGASRPSTARASP